MPLRDFLRGFSYPWRGLRILRQPRLRRLAIWPITINVVLFAVAVYSLAIAFSGWLDGLFPWWLGWLEWLLWPIFALMMLATLAFGFARFANLIAVPFNARLCQTLMQARPEDPLTLAAQRQTWRNDLRILWHEAVKLGVWLLVFVPLLLLTFVPVLGQLAQLVLLYFAVYWCALEYLDYPLSEAGVSMRGLRARLAEQRFLMLGFGAGQMLLMLVPLLNLAAIPSGVAAATRLCQECPPPSGA